MAGESVLLWGKTLTSGDPSMVVLDIEPRMGDAAKFKLTGQITFARRQCLEIREGDPELGFDLVRIPLHIAQLKSELAGNVRRRRR